MLPPPKFDVAVHRCCVFPTMGVALPVMRPKARKSCPNCRRLQAKLDAQEARLKVLGGTVARLQEQLAAARKDSSTSCKPPSSEHRHAAQTSTAGGPAAAPQRRATRSPQARTRRLPAGIDQRRFARPSPRFLPRVRAGLGTHAHDPAPGETYRLVSVG